MSGRLKPQLAGGKINTVKVGPKWTTITLRIATKTLKRAMK